jgi:hypothetical protein
VSDSEAKHPKGLDLTHSITLPPLATLYSFNTRRFSPDRKLRRQRAFECVPIRLRFFQWRSLSPAPRWDAARVGSEILVVTSLRTGQRQEIEEKQVWVYRKELEKAEAQLTDSGSCFRIIRIALEGYSPADALNLSSQRRRRT